MGVFIVFFHCDILKVSSDGLEEKVFITVTEFFRNL